MDLQRAMALPVFQMESWRQDNAEETDCSAIMTDKRWSHRAVGTVMKTSGQTWRTHLDNNALI